MTSRATIHLAALLAAMTGLGMAGCVSSNSDPAEIFLAKVNQSPPEKQPPDWERTYRLMTRRAPGVGEIAPDFTLTSLDSCTSITRSSFQGDRPLILIFGSFT